jgi:hypothetical protein
MTSQSGPHTFHTHPVVLRRAELGYLAAFHAPFRIAGDSRPSTSTQMTRSYTSQLRQGLGSRGNFHVHSRKGKPSEVRRRSFTTATAGPGRSDPPSPTRHRFTRIQACIRFLPTSEHAPQHHGKPNLRPRDGQAKTSEIHESNAQAKYLDFARCHHYNGKRHGVSPRFVKMVALVRLR